MMHQYSVDRFIFVKSVHIAGDGKLGGLVSPNDGQCHLNREGFYDWSTVQDYPSLGHINHVAQEHSVNIIWAVTSSHLPLYRGLTRLMKASVAGEISSDSSNIVELIEELYGKITTTVRVEDNSSDSVSVYYTAACTGDVERRRRRCRNIPLGTPVQFTAHLTLQSCNTEVITISGVGMEDKFLVEVEPVCSCGCEDGGVEGGEYCSGQGDQVCGECDCYAGFWGDHCQCQGEQGHHDCRYCIQLSQQCHHILHVPDLPPLVPLPPCVQGVGAASVVPVCVTLVPA